MSDALSLKNDPRYDASREIRAPRGTQLSCKNWITEAAYRMIQNNLDPEVAENPKHLVVYGGIGRAARGSHGWRRGGDRWSSGMLLMGNKHNARRPNAETPPNRYIQL